MPIHIRFTAATCPAYHGGHGSNSRPSRVTRAGWPGSTWRQPASPRRGVLGSGGVAFRASTPATPSCDLLLNHAQKLTSFWIEVSRFAAFLIYTYVQNHEIWTTDTH